MIWIWLRSATLLVLAIVVTQPAGAWQDNRSDVVVRVKRGASIVELAKDHGAPVSDHAAGSDLYTLTVPEGSTSEGLARALRRDGRVLYAEKDHLLAAPEFKGDPMHLPFDRSANPKLYLSQPAYAQIRADDLSTQEGAAEVIVAVLDTGVDLSHPALAGHLIDGYNAIAPGTDPLDIPDGSSNHVVGHGTMVAGLIARLAPRARIMPIRVLNGDGVGRLMDVVKGIRYAAAHGARVINMSFGSPVSSDALNDAMDGCEHAGVLCVAAAGNEGRETRQFPAEHGYAIAVASVDADDRKAVYSSYGPTVRICAPGTAIQSTFPDGSYAAWSGTSFAAPFVSATAALIFSRNPSWEAGKVSEAITSTARPISRANPAYRGRLGKGVLDVEKAVEFRG